MGFKDFITEAVDQAELEKAFAKIEKDCKPFLKHKRAIWRGVNTTDDAWGLKKVRKDRIPLGNNPDFSAFTNAFLDSKKLPNRSKSIFATAKKDYAMVFGNTCLIFPKGNFKHVWFPDIDDMNSHRYERFGTWLRSYVDDKSIFKKKFDDQVHLLQKQLMQDEMDGKDYDGELDSFVIQRGFTRYVQALENFDNKTFPPPDKRNEIIIDCKDYYWIKTTGGPFDKTPDIIMDRFNLK